MWLMQMGLVAALAQAPQAPTLASSTPTAATSGEYLIEGIPPGPAPATEAKAHELSLRIGAKMRCPVCQGMSVADSTSPAAVNFQNRIRELVAAGYTEDQIKAYFVLSYGEGILLEPTTKGLNLLVWVGPGLFAGLALAMAYSTVMQWRKEEDDVPLPSDVGLAPKDKYEERLLAELED